MRITYVSPPSLSRSHRIPLATVTVHSKTVRRQALSAICHCLLPWGNDIDPAYPGEQHLSPTMILNLICLGRNVFSELLCTFLTSPDALLPLCTFLEYLYYVLLALLCFFFSFGIFVPTSQVWTFLSPMLYLFFSWYPHGLAQEQLFQSVSTDVRGVMKWTTLWFNLTVDITTQLSYNQQKLFPFDSQCSKPSKRRKGTTLL